MKHYEACESCDGRGWIFSLSDAYGYRVEACDSCGKYHQDGEADDLAATEALEAYVLLLEELVERHGPPGYPVALYRQRLGFHTNDVGEGIGIFQQEE